MYGSLTRHMVKRLDGKFGCHMSCQDQPRLCGAYCDQFFRNAPPKLLVVIALIKVICYLIASLQFFPRKVCDSVNDFRGSTFQAPPNAKPFQVVHTGPDADGRSGTFARHTFDCSSLKPVAACAMWSSVQPQGYGGIVENGAMISDSTP
ncbi:hypothetical protein OJAV_G00126070 [Oryzias javanicus]|uniref:Uncharacterized protein n=1 Tax=Oryzias javanicus TaxID=123683 RepID=A0A437CNS6_ORYJA|nr:hypothetical protein OJAV_G00126070 [Oryzias javanicus]